MLIKYKKQYHQWRSIVLRKSHRYYTVSGRVRWMVLVTVLGKQSELKNWILEQLN